MSLALSDLAIVALACWRISSLLVRESGPLNMLVHIRGVASRSELGAGIFSCIWCMSLWVGLLLLPFLVSGYAWVLLPFALSALAIWFERRVQHNTASDKRGHS